MGVGEAPPHRLMLGEGREGRIVGEILDGIAYVAF